MKTSRRFWKRCRRNAAKPSIRMRAPIEKPVITAEKKPLTNLQRIRKIEEVLTSLRPQLMADGGDVELV